MGWTTAIGKFVNDITGVTSSNNFNAIEAQKQRDFEAEQANTQYQRTVEDMKAAGINPASLATGASLNSVASGSSASASGNGGSVIASVISAIVGIYKANAQVQAAQINALSRMGRR